MEFSQERFDDVIDEAYALLEKHLKEVWIYPDMPLDLNYNMYKRMDAGGTYMVYVARVDKKIVGYSAYIISPNLHHVESLWAYSDVLYLAPEHRGHGKEFIQYCESKLKDLGVHVISQAVTPRKDFSPMLERSGYELMDSNYTRRLQ